MKYLLLCLCILSNLTLTAQEIPVSNDRDVKIVIEESMINKVLSVIGPVSGDGNADIKISKVDYSWTVKKPVIHFENGRANFYADANIKVSGVNYSSPVTGYCDVEYDPKTNKLNLQVKSADFDLEFKVFGKKVKLGSVDVARFYSPKFEFDGPEPINQIVSMDLPDGKKSFQITTNEPELFINDGSIEIASNITVIEVPAETKVQSDDITK